MFEGTGQKGRRAGGCSVLRRGTQIDLDVRPRVVDRGERICALIGPGGWTGVPVRAHGETASGARAVQIVHSSQRGSRDIEHIGSAHDEAQADGADRRVVCRLGQDVGSGRPVWSLSAHSGRSGGGPV